MTIETKYDIGEFVWLLRDNNIDYREIHNIWINIDPDNQDIYIQYKFKSNDWWDVKTEKEIFSTKQHLLEYIASQ